MYRSCTFKRSNSTKTQSIRLHGVSEGKSTLMIYDRHPELQSKWIKRFGLEDMKIC